MTVKAHLQIRKTTKLLLLSLFLALPLHAQIITTIAGNGIAGDGGDKGLATNAQLNQPIALTIDKTGNVYLADERANSVRKIDHKGIITTISGKTIFDKPHDITVDPSGNIYVTEYNTHIIRKMSANGTITNVAGIQQKPASFGYLDIGKPATATSLNTPNGIAIDRVGNIYFADQWNYMILKISTTGILSVVAGNGYGGKKGNNGPATAAELNAPWGVVTDKKGSIYFTDIASHTVHKIDAAGIITTIAGTGDRGYSGDGGSATNATLNEPHGITIDDSGNVYIADAGNHAIRCIYTDNTIATIAGTGYRGYSGDGGIAVDAGLNSPYDVAVDKRGNVYIADALNHVIRKVTTPPRVKKELLVKEAFNIIADADKNELVVTIDSGAYDSYSITDIKGKTLTTHPISERRTRIDISTLQSAHYFIDLKKKEKVKTVMFVKNQ